MISLFSRGKRVQHPKFCLKNICEISSQRKTNSGACAKRKSALVGSASEPGSAAMIARGDRIALRSAAKFNSEHKSGSPNPKPAHRMRTRGVAEMVDLTP